MREFMKCVAEAVMENGVKGLAAMVPGGEFAYKVAEGAYKKYRDRKKQAEQPKEIEALAQTSFAGAQQEAAEAVREAAAAIAKANPQQATLSDADRARLLIYLSQIPTAVAQSLKRAEDPTGRTVSPTFAITSTEDLAKLLPPHAPRFQPGDPLAGKSGWVLDRPLGVGGFGEVWLARHERLASLVGAVKFCLGQQARDLQHESGVIDRVMQAGEHPNIVPLKDVSFDGPAPWLMYEYVPGGDLGDFIRTLQSRPPEERRKQAVAALRQIAAAVAYFHKLTPPVVHRDLKPNNILLDRANKRLRITDFGIGAVAAKAALAEESRGGTTAAGRLLSYMRGSHTPLYASPQQRNGSDPDPRDDVHALGVIAFQLLTGRLDAEVKGNWQKRLKADGTPDALIGLIGDSTSDDPSDRPKDARAWGEALAQLHTPADAAGGQTGITAHQSLAPAPAPLTIAAQPSSSAEAELEQAKPKNVRPVNAVAPGADTPATVKTINLNVAGIWYSRTASDRNGIWAKVTETPAEVTVLASHVYALRVSEGGQLHELVALQSVAEFQYLGLDHCSDMGEADLMHVGRLTGLRSLHLGNCSDISDLKSLRGLSDLKFLSVWATSVGDAGLKALPKLKRLRILDLSDSQVTDKGLGALKNLAALRSLRVNWRTAVTDRGLVHLSSLINLRRLSLWGTGITDAGLEHLAPLTGLRELVVGKTGITNKGLGALKTFTGLQKLNVSGTKVTARAVALAKTALPNCEIICEDVR